MAVTRDYTFENVQGNHTITATFEEGGVTPSTGGNTRIFLKQNGVWTPLFQES